MGSLYAHSKDADRSEWEELTQHLRAVADAAHRNAEAFDAGICAELAGWLHDLGKTKPGFQAKLRGEKNNTSHSGEGALYSEHHFGPNTILSKLLAYCIAGHHSGLPNGIARSERGRPQTPLKDRIIESEIVSMPDGVELPAPKAPGPLKGLTNNSLFEIQFLIRMLFSALVDADYIETERFYNPGVPRGCSPELDALRPALTEYLEQFPPPETEINVLRSEVLQASAKSAEQPLGFFTLTVPTGGGKTLSSLRFALDHAITHNLRRIIYVAPFTTIIEQTADVFRAALKDQNAVLEHHSTFEPSHQISDETQVERMQLAAQNWDRPVVVTTAVQFFESLFGNRTQKCRKLHNISNSVIVLDEAQALPVNFLRPCLAALKELVRGYGCSIVFCTATQPAIRDADGLTADEAIPANATREIAPKPSALYKRLKRVEVHFIGQFSNVELVARVKGQSALVIVNNKRQARAVFDLFGKDQALHLSTNMTPRHRREVLERIKDGFGGPVISTALVEAGVDLDFPEVWRAVAGLDSIVQAAGRCNREGKLGGLGQVHIFEPEEGFDPPPELRQNAEIARHVLKQYAHDPLHPDAVQDYFKRLYWDREADLDSRSVLKRIKRSGNEFDFPFADISADFQLIQEMTRPLIIGVGPFGIDIETRNLLEYSPYAGTIASAVQPFTVSVLPNIRNEMVQLNAARILRQDEFGDQFVVLDNPRLYDNLAGFSSENAQDLGVVIA